MLKLPPKILLIEYNESFNNNICNTIEKAWFDVIRSKSLNQALNLIKLSTPHIAIISSTIQNSSATEALVQLRKKQELNSLPVIFLVDKDEAIDKYYFFSKNYMEILARPFLSSDLISTIKSLLRKTKPTFQNKIIKYKNISMNLATFEVFQSEQRIYLSPIEFKILQLLLTSSNNILSRKEIVHSIWGIKCNISDRTIDVHINRIRNLIKADSKNKSLIKTIRSEGYCLV